MAPERTKGYSRFTSQHALNARTNWGSSVNRTMSLFQPSGAALGAKAGFRPHWPDELAVESRSGRGWKGAVRSFCHQLPGHEAPRSSFPTPAGAEDSHAPHPPESGSEPPAQPRRKRQTARAGAHRPLLVSCARHHSSRETLSPRNQVRGCAPHSFTTSYSAFSEGRYSCGRPGVSLRGGSLSLKNVPLLGCGRRRYLCCESGAMSVVSSGSSSELDLLVRLAVLASSPRTHHQEAR